MTHFTKFTKHITRFFLLPMAIITGILSPPVLAIPDVPFYSGNNITHYDPDGCGPGATGGDDSGGAGSAGNNLEAILKYFTGKGLTLAQAAGIAGNMQQESGLDPAIIQGGRRAGPNYRPVNGVGFGLVQWTFTSRQQPLVKLAEESNRKITDINLQLDNVWRELSGPYKHTLEALSKTNDPVQAAVIVHGPPYPGYEASADSADFVRRVRGGNATKFYNQFKGKIADGAGVVIDGETQTPGGSADACASGSASEFSDDGFVIYDQCDPRWASVSFSNSGKTACTSGCGPTAMAMAITALTGKAVTPKETVAYAKTQNLYQEGVGSKWTIPPVIGDKFGVGTQKIDMTVASINNTLKNGGLVILSGQGPAPFTTAGHYILIRGVTDSGKWKVADSNGKDGQENSKKEWDPRAILDSANAGSTYAVTK